MFIRRRKHYRSIATVLLALFLLSSVVTQSRELLNSCFKSFGFVLGKAKTSTASSYQFPYEETEKEEKQSAEEKTVTASWLTEWLLIGLNFLSELC
jgi:hypothetical protein